MATKVQVYNEALRFLGESLLTTVTDDVESRYVLDDAYDGVVLFVTRAAPWRFALKTRNQAANDPSEDSFPSYDNDFNKFSGLLRTQAIYRRNSTEDGKDFPVDVREQTGRWFANGSTQITVCFVSDDYVDDPSVWPEQFTSSVAARLAFETADRITGQPAKAEQMFSLYQRMLEEAKLIDAIPESPWLMHQISGRFVAGMRSVLEMHDWKWALSQTSLTGATTSPTPALPYGYQFTKPSDYVRANRVARQVGDRLIDVDFMDQGGYFHADYTPLVVRYVPTTAWDTTTWPGYFEACVLAWCDWDAAKSDIALAQLVEQRFLIFKDAYKTAKLKDDMIERPKITNSGRFNQARFGGGSYLRREQGW